MSSQSTRRGRRVRLTPRDRLILELAAEHRLILATHAAALMGATASAAATRLRALCNGGYVTATRLFAGQPACYQISRSGLDVVGSPLPRPRIDLRGYAHDVGLAWVWLAARDGAFGPMREVVSERTMRSRDGIPRPDRPEGAGDPLGVRLGGAGHGGRDRLRYPDLLLITPAGGRVAVELELTAKSRARRDRILAGYGSDPRIEAVLYLVERPALAASIRASARRLGISHHVHVQWVRHNTTLPVDGALAAARSNARTSGATRP